MKKPRFIIFFSAFLLAAVLTGFGGQENIQFDRYHDPEEINIAVKAFHHANPEITVLHQLAESPGGHPLLLLEIGLEIEQKQRRLPSIFVASGPEGTTPLSGEAALFLIQSLLNKPESYQDKTWYICPAVNPDASWAYFQKPLRKNPRNQTPHNDDMDDQTDEDGPDDLDEDGFITTMRVKDPMGEWLPVDSKPRLLKKADPAKGEQGQYKIYSEGLDNDRDGQYNEDGKGGVNLGLNFPHLFKHHTKTGGPWAGSEAETYALMKFMTSHRDIAMVITLGATNFCHTPPRSGRRGSVNMEEIKIPRRYASMLGADPDQTYTLEEVMKMAEPLAPQGIEVTESMIAQLLGLGAVVNPLPEDLKYYEAVSKEYREFLKSRNIKTDRFDPPRAKDGSFELWAYYHLGLPSFSLDFWSLPKPEEKKSDNSLTPEKLEKMTAEEFLELGEEKIAAFLKEAGVPKQYSAAKVMEAVKGGMMTPKQMAAMLEQRSGPQSEDNGVSPKQKAFLTYSDTQLNGKGFVDWASYSHPDLGKIEIGGEVPFAASTPQAGKISALLENQVPWILELAKKTASIAIHKADAESLGSGMYKIKAWVQNKGYLPYPTAMGQRNNRILPVILTLDGADFTILEGKPRMKIPSLEGGQVRKTEWLIRLEKPGSLTMRAETENAGQDSTVITLGGSK
jgi:hypothetical protein